MPTPTAGSPTNTINSGFQTVIAATTAESIFLDTAGGISYLRQVQVHQLNRESR